MIVVPPLTITDAMFTSSTAVEPRAPSAYAGGTTYAIGDIVKDSNIVYQSLIASNTGNTPAVYPDKWEAIGYNEVAYNAATAYAVGDYVYFNHRNYISLQAANTGHNPVIYPTWWSDVGPTNKWAMLDLLRNTPTTLASPLTIVITPGSRCDTIGFVGLVADSIRVQVTSGGTSVYDTTTSLTDHSYIGDWYDYFFASFTYKNSALFLNLPPYTNMIITVTISRTSGNVQCGSMVLGMAVDLGAVQYNAQDDALNFSTIDRDIYGNSVLTRRRSVPKTNQVTWLDKTEVRNVRATREALNASPALWAGVSDDTNAYFDSLLILGIYKQFTIDLAYTDKAVLTLELEEV